MKLNGLGVALTTPFKKSLEIDFSSLETHVDYLLNSKIDYIVLLGTTSESPTLLSNEKIEILNFVYKIINKKIPLVLGIGGNSTKSVINEINSYDHSKFDSILSVCPYYNLPSQEGLFNHFNEIALNSKLPIVLYNVPSRTGCNLSAETVFKLSANKNIIGIKEANPDLEQLKKIIKLCPSSFQVVSGDDLSVHKAINFGAVGSISVIGNAFPKQFKNLINLSISSDQSLSEKAFYKLKRIINLIFEEGNPTGIKCLLNNLGFYENFLRMPLTPASEELKIKIIKEIKYLSYQK
tara:strand:+ start:1378 stop:2259 length:882 start_codon:yes stop_codon:yes gene_type:complete